MFENMVLLHHRKALSIFLPPILLQIGTSIRILEMFSFARRPYVSGGVFGIY